MRLAFEPDSAPLRHAFQSEASFSAKRLTLVEKLENNGINKEIRRPHALCGHFLKLWLTIFGRQTASGSCYNHRITIDGKHYLKATCLRQQPRVIGLHRVSIDRRVRARPQELGNILRQARVESGG